MTRVLLCDDSPQIRELVRVVLELEGNEVVSEAERLQPDVVLLDLSMPVMDGLEALPEIKRVAPDARVVVLSGFDNQRLVSQALALGADDYVPKGGDPEEIVDAVAGKAA
jgi:DNA-binding NarL/FixJ family response regulator